MRWTLSGFAATLQLMTCNADHPIHLQRIDAARNMWRFYELALQPTLFGELSLVRTWGRIGSSGQCKIVTFPEVDEAARALKRLAAAKRRRGYDEIKLNVTDL
jgi:predicted DNA-binding WGR domain protein